MAFPKVTGLVQFIKAAMSEPATALREGSASFSRVAAGVIIGFVLMWVTYLVLKTHAMPDLSGPTLFMTGGASATYGTNRVMAVIDKKTDQDHDHDHDHDDKSSVVVVPVMSAPTQIGN
jgi:hypothetical protein